MSVTGIVDSAQMITTCGCQPGDLLSDAQTSGGLLIAVPSEKVELLEQNFVERQVPVHCIGEVVAGHGGQLILES